MAVYLVGAFDIHDQEGYRAYQQGAQHALAPYEVEIVSADDHPLILEGAQPGGHLVIVKFKSMDELRAFYNSEAYQRVVQKRHSSSETRFLMVMRGAQ